MFQNKKREQAKTNPSKQKEEEGELTNAIFVYAKSAFAPEIQLGKFFMVHNILRNIFDNIIKQKTNELLTTVKETYSNMNKIDTEEFKKNIIFKTRKFHQ